MDGVVRLPLSFSMICTEPFCHTPTQLHAWETRQTMQGLVRAGVAGQGRPLGRTRVGSIMAGPERHSRAIKPEACAQVDADGLALVL